MAGCKDRKFFWAYYLSDDGETICGIKPFQFFRQGMIGEKHLLCVPLSELDLKESNGVFESANMPLIEADYFFENFDIVFDNLEPYAEMVVGYDRYNGKDDFEIIEQRGFLIHPCFVGKTFDEVCAKYPIEYETIISEDGSETQKETTWANSNEGQ